LTDPVQSIVNPAVFSPNNPDNPNMTAGCHLRATPAYDGESPERVFRQAQRLVRWHYQWIVVHEFLPMTIGQDRVDLIMSRGPRFYNVDDGARVREFRNGRNEPLIPIEFSVAVCRFGHSQVRPSYRLNFGADSASPVFVFAFDDTVIALTPAQLSELAPYGMEQSTPLWYYILKEAEVMESGLRMGPVGGGIVGEVFIGLLKADSSSYLSADRRWRPELPSATPGQFRMTDLLEFAGVVPPLN
jgi:hypothetical protein